MYEGETKEEESGCCGDGESPRGLVVAEAPKGDCEKSYRGAVGARSAECIRRWTVRLVVTVVLAVPLWWVGGMVHRDHKRHKDSWVLDELRERAQKDTVLRMAIDDADRAYREMLEEQRDEDQSDGE